MEYIISNKKKIIVAIALFIVLIIGILVSSYGFLRVEADKNTTISYLSTSDDSNERNELSPNKSTFVKNDDYFVRSESQNGSVSSKYVTTKRFLQSTNISLQNNTFATSTLALNAGSFVGPILEKGVQTFDYSGSTGFSNFSTSEITDDEVNVPPLSDFVYLTPSLLAAYIQSEDTITPFVYDFTKSEATYYSPFSLGVATTPVSVERINENEFFVYVSGVGLKRYVADNTDSNPKTIEFGDQKPATFNTNPLISVSSTTIAVINGPDTLLSADGEGSDLNSNTFELKLFTLDGRNISSQTIDEPIIQSIYLSPDGNKTAIKTSSSFKIVDNKTNEIVYVFPSAINDFMWIDESRFSFSSVSDGALFLGDVKTGDAVSIYPKNTVNFSAFTYVDKDKLVFSAFPTNNGVKQNPNIYSVDVTKKVSSSQLSSIPVQSDEYYIYEINGDIHIQLTRYITDEGTSFNNGAKDKALQYLNDKGIDGNVVEEFVDVDLR